MTDEKALIARVKNGNINGFRELVEQYKRLVYYFAYDLVGNHHDAEDLSQEVFIKVYRSIRQFRGESKLATWLYRITVNTWLDMKRVKNYPLRKMQKYIDHEEMEIPDHVDARKSDPEKATESSLFQKHLRLALDKLSSREKSIFVLRHFHDQKISDIGQSLNLSTGAVKSTLFRTIKKLQKALAFYQEENFAEKS